MRRYLFHTVGESGGSRFVNDSFNLQTSNLSRILSRLTLCIIEIGGDSDDGLANRGSEVILSGLFHLT